MNKVFARQSRASAWRRGLGMPSRSLALVALATGLGGCAALNPGAYVTDRLEIDKVGSSRADVVSVAVREDAGRTMVFGRLEKRQYGRSEVPGHLNIELFGRDGSRLANACADYRPLNAKQGTAQFARDIQVSPDAIDSVRVTHIADGACGAGPDQGSNLLAPVATVGAAGLAGARGARSDAPVAIKRSG